MATVDENAQYDLASKILENRPDGANYGPGPYACWFLAHHIAAGEVLFADLWVDPNSTRESRSGRIFLVTRSDVVFVEYENAAETRTGASDQDFGAATVTFFPTSEHPVDSVKWTGRSLYIPEHRYSGKAGPVKLKAKAVTVTTRGWTVELPYEQVDDADEYFERLRIALGLAVAAAQS